MVFHEAPHKLLPTLSDFQAAFGPDRRISLCRELTKLHEEVLRTTLSGAIEHYNSTPPKGEFVLVIEGAPPAQEEEYTLEDGLELVDKLQAEGASTRDAVKQAAAAYKLSKKALYDLAIAWKDED